MNILSRLEQFYKCWFFLFLEHSLKNYRSFQKKKKKKSSTKVPYTADHLFFDNYHFVWRPVQEKWSQKKYSSLSNQKLHRSLRSESKTRVRKNYALLFCFYFPKRRSCAKTPVDSLISFERGNSSATVRESFYTLTGEMCLHVLRCTRVRLTN